MSQVKVNVGWRRIEERDENISSYRLLESKYRIANYVVTNSERYDVIVNRVGDSSVSIIYKVIKNAPGLSADELALICDKGNLCFGYVMKDDRIIIYTD